MQTPCKAAHIANFILGKAEEDGVSDISILKLLKLVYIFFGWTSAIHPRIYLFSDPIEAWDYGPVVPSLYYELRGSGKKAVERRATLYDPFGEEDPKQPTEEDITDDKIRETLNIIWGAYKDAPAEHLVALTHKEDTPWWETFDGTRNKEIPKILIRDYYGELYKKLN